MDNAVTSSAAPWRFVRPRLFTSSQLDPRELHRHERIQWEREVYRGRLSDDGVEIAKGLLYIWDVRVIKAFWSR